MSYASLPSADMKVQYRRSRQDAKPKNDRRLPVKVFVLVLLILAGYAHLNTARLEPAVALPPPTVIIGGGIIGISTAYYLATSLGDGSSITIVDNEPNLFRGASGQALGRLRDSGYRSEINPLAKFSWDLFEDLALRFNGRESWGHSSMVVHEPSLNDSRVGDPSLITDKYPLPSWFRDSQDFINEILFAPEHAGHIRPYQFCEFLRKQCEEYGVKILLDSEVAAVDVENNAIKSVDIKNSTGQTTVPCQNIVISAGAWSQSVLERLFPNSQVIIPLNSTSDYHLNVRVPTSNDEKPYCDQLFLEKLLGEPMDISDFLGGDIYVAGYKVDRIPMLDLPGKVSDVIPDPELIKQMEQLARRFLNISRPEDLQVIGGGRALRPVLSYDRPMISHIPLDLLLGESRDDFIQDEATDRSMFEGSEKDYVERAWLPSYEHFSWLRQWIMNRESRQEKALRKNMGPGGVFVNVGHGSDGIKFGPGSGKVMSEMIQGLDLSIDVSFFGFETG